ncbi:hypothetical protein [Hellea balneolensis]|uniref:hypothetical protein n=1 Tax=Hellea balneolensis TaxID=287478 RepID=UPI00040C8A23|nr:hypothetical protein [Hellea balneolensis]
MRNTAMSLMVFAMLVPGTAMACHHGQASSINVSCEQGVRVYRAAPMPAPVAPVVIVKKSNTDLAQQRAALQSERLAAQADRLDALESRLEQSQRPKRRRNVYSAPVGAFGAAPFINRRRGFKSRRNSGIKVRYNRRIRS